MHVVLSPASVLCALLAVSITALALPLVREYRRKARIAKGLSPIPGPKGWPLLGILPDLLSNAHRINDRLVSSCARASASLSYCRSSAAVLK